MFQVNVTNSRGRTNQVNCNAPVCTIGKSGENLVVLQGWDVGRKHAAIITQDDGLYVRDEGTKGGTYLNGKKISGIAGPLSEEDVIKIGSYELVVMAPKSTRVDAPEAAGKPAPAEVPAPAPAADKEPVSAAVPESATEAGSVNGNSKGEFATLRLIHERIIARMDFRRMDISRLDEKELRKRTRDLIVEIIDEDPDLTKGYDREQLIRNALNEAVGLGPLETLLEDDTVSEVMVNRYNEIFIERNGRLQQADVVFSSDKSVLSAIERIIAPLGRRIDEGSPMVDGRLKDGSRVNAVIPPLALKGPNITIRKFSKRKLGPQDLVNYGSANKPMLDFLELCVKQRRNVLISGGTGSGKTTLLNILSNHIPDGERVITVEDAAELQLSMSNLISLEARPANVEGKGAVSIRDLVRNCLRMRPDRIVVGECRGGEALDMLQAMNTGHDGSLTTVHANAPRDALARLEVMVLMAGMELPVSAIRQQISSAVNLIVQQSRLSDGSRKITHVTEVTGMENGVIQLQDLFLFKQQGYDADNRVAGEFAPTGRVPEFYEELAARGLDVDRSIFFKENAL